MARAPAFDMSKSDLKQVEAPLWIEPGRGKPILMLFPTFDDRSGIVYGEDMAPKPEPKLPFQGIPATIYMDNGPVSRSKVSRSVMGSLGVRVLTHMPPSRAERRTPARSKGKSLPSGLTDQEGHHDHLPHPLRDRPVQRGGIRGVCPRIPAPYDIHRLDGARNDMGGDFSPIGLHFRSADRRLPANRTLGAVSPLGILAPESSPPFVVTWRAYV
jgi:hypothetical protein